jgi:hypothetical protein
MTGKNNGLPSRQNLIDAISRVDFYSFVQRIFPIVSAGSPFLPNWHVEAITYALTRVMRGEIKRLIITVPPRSLKSICASVAFPAFVLGYDPTRRIIEVSYSEGLARKHANDFRAVIRSPLYRRLFPGTRISAAKDTELEVMTMLEIEPGELMAEYRPSLTPEGQEGRKAEIFLYDTLPGGAGFSNLLVDRGVELCERALQLLKTCPEDCDASCYRCLRSFKNKFEHILLDRHVGAELLEYLLNGQLPQFDPGRLKKSTGWLFSDLRRQGGETQYQEDASVSIGKGAELTIPILAIRKDGKQFSIALSGPLTSGHPADESLLQLSSPEAPELIVINELKVRGNLPAATREVLQRLAL